MKLSISIPIRAGSCRQTLFCQSIQRFFFLLFLFSSLHFLNASAATVRQVSVEEMTQASELVFEGQVVEVVPKLDVGGGQIHTLVTFQILDVIKGSYAQPKIALSFLGGTVNGLTLEVSDMHFPVLGEKGIYFVESLGRTQIHPLFGWDQGHFVIKTDSNGVPRVMTRDQRTVTGVASLPRTQVKALSTGVAGGVVISADGKEKGLSVSEFKLKLRDINRGQP
ncbi:MAG: hypothetical protein U0V70_11260 [Terriglobia bacterium]